MVRPHQLDSPWEPGHPIINAISARRVQIACILMQPCILTAPQGGDFPALLIVELSEFASDEANGPEFGGDKGVEGREEGYGGDSGNGEVLGCHGVAAVVSLDLKRTVHRE